MKEEERQIDRKLLDALERLGEAFRYLKSDIAREYGVSNLQMRVMTHLIQCPEKEPSNSELAREFGIARATLGEVIQKLREKGWVQRERSSRDRRKYGLKTTRKGEALAGELSSYMSTLEAPLSKVGRSEKEALYLEHHPWSDPTRSDQYATHVLYLSILSTRERERILRPFGTGHGRTPGRLQDPPKRRSMRKSKEELLQRIEERDHQRGQDPLSTLEGALHQKPVTYWEYIGTDLLLNMQNPRTEFPDEKIFIMYHQVTELFFKMMRHELDQVLEMKRPSGKAIDEHIRRVNRYAGILTTSFDIMRDGMDPGQYDQFRTSLTPASGFQSAQYRMLEFQCTDLDRLVHKDQREQVPEDAHPAEWFDELYWQEAGKDPRTGAKNQMLSLFEGKYRDELIRLMEHHRKNNLRSLWYRLPKREKHEKLEQSLRSLDHTLNVEWPLVHLRTAEHYLESGEEQKAATGGSSWKKYLHPAHQRRIFFPELWSEQELEEWGMDGE